MGDILDNLMGPKIKGGFPGPTLAELVKIGFERLGPFATKRDDEGKVVEAYQRVLGKEYYQLSSVEAYDLYFDGIASKLRAQLQASKAGTSA